jgi:hypothetical protein
VRVEARSTQGSTTLEPKGGSSVRASGCSDSKNPRVEIELSFIIRPQLLLASYVEILVKKKKPALSFFLLANAHDWSYESFDVWSGSDKKASVGTSISAAT